MLRYSLSLSSSELARECIPDSKVNQLKGSWLNEMRSGFARDVDAEMMCALTAYQALGAIQGSLCYKLL